LGGESPLKGIAVAPVTLPTVTRSLADPLVPVIAKASDHSDRMVARARIEFVPAINGLVPKLRRARELDENPIIDGPLWTEIQSRVILGKRAV
jgi:hypothetical protein